MTHCKYIFNKEKSKIITETCEIGEMFYVHLSQNWTKIALTS